MTHKEKAMKIFYERFNCSQAVLGAYADDHGLTADQAMKVAACFSGGVRKGEVCGAVSGAIMVIGLKYGDGPDYKAAAYPKAAEFMDRFKENMLHISAGSFSAVTYPPKRECSMPGRMVFLRISVREW